MTSNKTNTNNVHNNTSDDLYIIDGHAHIYAAFYAPMRQKLTSPDGEPTKATYVFTTILLSLLNKKDPKRIAVAMDSKVPSFRTKIYPEYKAHRPPMPDDMPVQIARIEEILQAFGIPILRVDGFEADDIIGTLAKQASKEAMDVYICSKDKDMLQLLGPRVSTYDIKSDKVFGVKELDEKMGVSPEQFVDVLALQGDTSDNIPGVADVGPKTALSWIQKYGSIKDLYDNIDKIGGKRGNSLANSRDQVDLSRELVVINTDVPLDIELSDLKRREPDADKLSEVFTRLGFTRLLSQMGLSAAPGKGGGGGKGSAGGSGQLFDSGSGGAGSADSQVGDGDITTGPASIKTIKKNYVLVDTDEKFDEFLSQLKTKDLFAFDTETTSVDPSRAQLVGMSFSWERDSGYYLPVKGPMGAQVLSSKTVADKLGPIMADEGVKKIGQNIKYDIIVMHNAGIEVKGVYFDTMVASYCLDSDRRHSMDAMALDFLNYETVKLSSLIGKGKNQLTFDMVDTANAADYAAEDADITFALYEYLSKRLSQEAGIEKLFRELEMPLVAVLAQMEINGVSLDLELLREMSNELSDEVDSLQEQIYSLAGTVFNIDSPKQLAEVLFDELGLESIRNTKTSRSTDAAVLEQLSDEHEIVPLILSYRQLMKLKNTYVDKLGKLIDPRTGRLHASFNQTITATGRLSSSNPNLQNIPIRTELGRKIRRAFVPEKKENCIVSADYSQIELRLLAHFSGDEALCSAFADDLDIHRFVASQIYEVDESEVTDKMRSNCKAVNFGIIYGQGAFGLSKTIGIPQGQAKKFIEDYFKRYSSIKEFMEGIVKQAKGRGYAETIMGRQRRISGLDSRNFNTRTSAERMAVNTTIQGSAADLIKVAMVNIQRKIDRERLGVKMLLQIHDELVFEMVSEGSEDNVEWIREEMVGALDLRVPLKVDVSVGDNWLGES
jgi:DNA polymerase-1